MLSCLSSFADQREYFAVSFYFKKYPGRNIKLVKGFGLHDFPKLPLVHHSPVLQGLVGVDTRNVLPSALLKYLPVFQSQ